MKKTYMQPRTQVVKVNFDGQLLAGSPTGSRVYNESANENEEAI